MSVPSVSLPVQETGTCATSCSNFFQSIGNGISSGASWFGRNVQLLGSTIADYAQQAVETARPYFEKMKEAIVENQNSIIIGVVCAAIGAIGYALFSQLCPTSPAPAPVPAAPAAGPAVVPPAGGM